MIPSVISQQTKQGIEGFLRTTFPIHTPFFDGVIERFLAGHDELFKGPYISVKLPFRPGSASQDVFPDVPMQYPPYLHQEQAFSRIAGNTPQSTIVATGTGSGKTECFMYPILDYCYQNRDQRGIKAIIVYPMNALANDQAKRFAREIHQNPKLNGAVRVGMYVGQKGAKPEKATRSMQPDQVITNRETLRLSPPDILLTNYKMLDYLMIRPADFPLWQDNEPETLRFLVVDELHTFDGAQGTDLACLIRRLKKRLQTPRGYLCCIGTSATLGGNDITGNLVNYVSDVFGEPFDRNSVIMESLLSPAEFLGSAFITHLAVPGPETVDQLNADHHATIEDYLRAQIRLWFGRDVADPTTDEGKVKLGTELLAHVFFNNLLRIAGTGIQTLEKIIFELDKKVPGFAETNTAYKQHLIASMLSLVSAARRGPNDQESEDGGRPRPLLDIRFQLWMREVRRMVCSVEAQAQIRFSHDLTPEQSARHLPLVHCRECGSTGWAAVKRKQDADLNADLQKFYEAYFAYSPTVHYLFPDAPPEIEKQRSFQQILCGHCLHLTDGDNVGKCPGCARDDRLIPIFVHNPRLATQGGSTLKGSHNCPYCNAHDGLTVLGSRAASLISVAISHLFTSRFNDDKKLLAFSDSVQDAAHRAGFFAARTYRFNFRGALQQLIASEGDGLPLSELPARFITRYRAQWSDNTFVANFLAPDMNWREDYDILRRTGTLPEESDLVSLVEKRVNWEITAEYGFGSRVGRTLEKTGSSVAAVDPARLKSAAAAALDPLRNEIGGLERLSERRLLRFMDGFLTYLKGKGGIFHPALEQYVHDLGGYYMLGKIPYMRPVGRLTRTPIFLTTRRGTRFDQLFRTGTTPTRYENWAQRTLGDLCPQIADYAQALFEKVLTALVDADVLDLQYGKGEPVWGLRRDALIVTTAVRQCRCGRCGHNVSVPADHLAAWTGSVCLRDRCDGHYVEQKQQEDFYARFYAHGDIQRIFAAEHTGMLDADTRRQVEDEFMENKQPWDTNLLSCTPTLEMGIDIGSLSSAVLCSVPPNQASYLQRIGRTGRRDGNSFNLAVANGVPHDLYFYADPLQMLAGTVEPPGCFLHASAVLERQFTAFCFDKWVQTKVDPNLLPRKLGKVLNNMRHKQKAKLFPHVFLDFLELHRTDFFAQFVMLFDNLPDWAVDRLRQFVEGSGDDVVGLRVRILSGLENIAAEVKSLRERVRLLNAEIKRLQETKAKDHDHEEQMDELEREKTALSSIATSLVDKDTFNFFTDEGLLPNYAFPEEGVQLRSVILWKKRKIEEGKGKFRATVYEYERPAVSAIHELAPSNLFFAGGRRVRIDQVDMNLSEIENWRFCDSCTYMENTALNEEKARCPKCGSEMWRDEHQAKDMLKMHQVIATSFDRASRIQDDSDDRDPEFFNKLVMLDVDDSEVSCAYKIDAAELPFGFELVRRVTFREVNFGNRKNLGETMPVAGHEFPRTGFVVCKKCGMVQGIPKPGKKKDELVHAIGCPGAKAKSPDEVLDCVYLYREFASEAIRILLPVSSFVGRETRLQSFIAAIWLGLKLKFRGNIDHLHTALQDEPLPENPAIRKSYLILYDQIPGGTGYLKELMQTGNSMIELFELALAHLKSCECQKDADADGCYRCVYGRRNSFDIPMISRSEAISLLTSIVERKDSLTETDTITKISQNVFIESELEAFFIEALRRAKFQGQGALIKKEIVNHKTGWFLEINGRGYYVEPQVDVGDGDGVTIMSRPDFIIYPERQEETKPIAIFADGFIYHADTATGKSRVGDDTAKRMALTRSRKYVTWSLTWQDIAAAVNGDGKAYLELLRKQGATCQKLLRRAGADVLGSMNGIGSFEILVRYLAAPNAKLWQAYARVQTQLFLDPKQAAGNLEDRIRSVLAPNDLWANLVIPEPTDAVSGDHRDVDAAGEIVVDLAAWTTRDAIQSDSNLDLYLLCRLNDEPERVTRPEFKNVWNGFWRLHNLLQFLPNAYFFTSQGLEDAAYEVLQFTDAPVDERFTMLADSDGAVKELCEVTDKEYHAALREMAKANIPLPMIPCELTGSHGEIVAEAEMGWDNVKTVLIETDNMEATTAFSKAGWTVLSLDELAQAPATTIAKLKEIMIS